MKYALIREYDIANGPGIRVSLFVSGCRHKCKGCFNAEARDFAYGKEFEEETVDAIIELLKRDAISGLTLLGGEPLEPENQERVLRLVKRARQEIPEKTIRCYSGFTYEQVQKMCKTLPHTKEIFKNVDVLVDGKFEIDLANYNLQFRGSANQRVIDIPKTYEAGTIIRALPEEEQEKYVSSKALY